MSAPISATLALEDEASAVVVARLRQIAGTFDPALRTRVARLLMASSEAILRLADIDLVRYESGGGEGTHTLAVWEELAPAMAGTVESVNELIGNGEQAFPPPPDEDPIDNIDAAFGPEAGDEPAKPGEDKGVDVEIAQLLAGVTSGMRRDVARLGERLRNPTVMADPWKLISDLLEFRGRLRAGLGELIYQVVSYVAEVERADVIPGYAADLEQSLMVRQATCNLAFLFRGHTKRIAAAADDRVPAALQDALKDLQAFGRTRALPALRTSDKRIFLETRAELNRLARKKPIDVGEVRNGVENLARFLDSMSVVSRRENLRLHDRAQLAAVGRHLETAQSAVRNRSPAGARAELVLAVRAAAPLYGRDAQLDAYLRGQRHFVADWILDGEVTEEVEKLAGVLAAIPAP